MFIKYDDQSIRYTGRFGQFRTWRNDSHCRDRLWLLL